MPQECNPGSYKASRAGQDFDFCDAFCFKLFFFGGTEHEEKIISERKASVSQ